MGRPVKLPDDLLLDARVAAEAARRSIAGQIEFWVRVGKAVEGVLRADRVPRLKRRGEAVALSAANDIYNLLFCDQRESFRARQGRVSLRVGNASCSRSRQTFPA